MSTLWHVRIYNNGQPAGVLSGAGRNRGTWDATHSRTAAYRIARDMNARHDGRQYKAEPEGPEFFPVAYLFHAGQVAESCEVPA